MASTPHVQPALLRPQDEEGIGGIAQVEQPHNQHKDHERLAQTAEGKPGRGALFGDRGILCSSARDSTAKTAG